ncbi:uncharacterized protein K02A2.6-like [Stylophora pistillata]|uniref:uncharacterized protein K02A2.6-like n=1 Tax=Stylophora pistillata TaxID=50429 RepID=UPI000C03E5B4|nr:uncharacterized protein K02A2.6-like [Stylophora pistillata]
MQKLAQRIAKGDWDKHKKDKDVEPYTHIKQELSTGEELIFRQERIVLPEKLQRKVVKIGHSLGHLGKTKTKKFFAKIATREKQTEPIKTTTIPDRPWDIVPVDFGGPYPDRDYNLVIIDKRTRVETDNGPPFNSKQFKDFAREERFEHHKVTPLHPRASGEVERFVETINKTKRIAHLQGKDKLESQNAIHNMLTAYRLTPHPATGISPHEEMRGTFIRTKLDYSTPNQQSSEEDEQMNVNDAKYKERMKTKRENSRTEEKRLLIGDYALAKQERKNKWSTPYEPIFYIVCDIEGSKITARRTTDGRTVSRDASHFKLVNSVINTVDKVKDNAVQHGTTPPDTKQQGHKEESLSGIKKP